MYRFSNYYVIFAVKLTAGLGGSLIKQKDSNMDNF